MGISQNLIGKQFGELTVIAKGEPIIQPDGTKLTTWLCECSCGNTTMVRTSYLNNHHTTSCGCKKKKTLPATFEDLTGQKYGHLTVMRYLQKDERRCKGYNWLCRCDCGNYTHANATKLKMGVTKTCGCKIKNAAKIRGKNLIGQKFNNLTVIGWIEPQKRKHSSFCWKCLCDCGNETVSTTQKLINNAHKSCGCKRMERIIDGIKKYKYSNKRLYTVYKAMLVRCSDPRDKKYKQYGGRGITVCSEWQGEKGYDVFAEWAFKNGYDPDAEWLQCTLDRIDVNGNYEPSNCRWISNDRQQNNRTNCCFIEYKGKTQSLADWAREFNIPYKYMEWRVIAKNNKHRMTIQECVDSFYK